MTNNDDLVVLTRRDDGVALVELANGKANTLSRDVLARLAGAAEALIEDPPGAVVITGRGRMFAAGAEIAEFGGPEEAEEITAAFHGALDAVAAIPRVVIAAVNGFALGGGCELALACDLRIAADNARLGQPEILLGIIPGGGGTQRLARLVGPGRAKELMVTGRQVRAEEALNIGLVERVVPADDLLEEALTQAAALAAGPVVAQHLVKRAVDEGLESSLDDGLMLERTLFRDVFTTEDARIGVASFLEHGPGKADFLGH
ncbi:MAG: enoyl-CoA hydratase/isomerase family protein [Acidimicrobiia bacterium]|nr:enoyl-CoA hydratase/isomerase family protein [Acidimicrobiia bacterium]